MYLQNVKRDLKNVLKRKTKKSCKTAQHSEENSALVLGRTSTVASQKGFRSGQPVSCHKRDIAVAIILFNALSAEYLRKNTCGAKEDWSMSRFLDFSQLWPFNLNKIILLYKIF